MRLLTCEKCPEDIRNKDRRFDFDCSFKKRVREALVGNHIQWTSIQFRCSKLKSLFVRGLIVTVKLAYLEINEEGYSQGDYETIEYSGTVIGWKGRKVLVWIHEPDEYVKSKWNVIKVWPKQISGWKTDRVFEGLCPECSKPVDRERTRVPDRRGAGTDTPSGFSCDICDRRSDHAQG